MYEIRLQFSKTCKSNNLIPRELIEIFLIIIFGMRFLALRYAWRSTFPIFWTNRNTSFSLSKLKLSRIISFCSIGILDSLKVFYLEPF